MNSAQNELLTKIKGAVFNSQHLHVADKRRVACIFYNPFKQNGPNYSDGFQASEFIDALPPNYSEITKQRILDIMEVIAMLAHCDEKCPSVTTKT